MKIRTRFNLIFTTLATIILIFFAATVFWISKKSREKEYYDILKNEAIIKANLFTEASLSPTRLQKIYASQNKSSDKINIAIYHDFPIKGTQDSINNLLERVKSKKELTTKENSKHILGLEFKSGDKDFIVLASGEDYYGQRKMYELLYILGFTAIISIAILYAL